MITQSYLILWHFHVVSLEALWISCQCHFMTSEQFMLFTDSRLLCLQLPMGQRWTQRSNWGHPAASRAVYRTSYSYVHLKRFERIHFEKQPVDVMRSPASLNVREDYFLKMSPCFFKFLCSGWIAWPVLEEMPMCTTFYVSIKWIEKIREMSERSAVLFSA